MYDRRISLEPESAVTWSGRCEGDVRRYREIWTELETAVSRRGLQMWLVGGGVRGRLGVG